jgi:hypothetical protein
MKVTRRITHRKTLHVFAGRLVPPLRSFSNSQVNVISNIICIIRFSHRPIAWDSGIGPETTPPWGWSSRSANRRSPRSDGCVSTTCCCTLCLHATRHACDSCSTEPAQYCTEPAMLLDASRHQCDSSTRNPIALATLGVCWRHMRTRCRYTNKCTNKRTWSAIN